MLEPKSVELPVFVVVEILSLLSSKNRVAECGRVNHVWQTAANEVRLNWIDLFVIPLSETAQLHFFNTCTPHMLEETRKLPAMQINNVEPFVDPDNTKFTRISTAEGKKKFYVCNFGYDYELKSLVPDNFKNDIVEFVKYSSDQCQLFPRLLRQSLYDIKLKSYHDRCYSHIYHVELSVKELERMAKEKYVKVPFPLCFNTMIEAEHIKMTDLFKQNLTFEDIHIPKKAISTQVQPFGFAKSVNLYKYQLDVVAWMKSIETDVKTGFDFVDLLSFPSSFSKLRFDILLDYAVAPHQFSDFCKTVYPSGGILADEMGLGKTMEILANPGNPSILDVNSENKEKNSVNEEINKQKEVLQAEKDKRNASVFSYYGNHKKPVVREQSIKRGENTNDGFTENSKFIRTGAHGERFVTNATLVLCPAILIKQWTKEIETNTKPNLNFIVLDTVRAVKNCTSRDIMDADVVLFPHELLLDFSYFNIGSLDLFPPTYKNSKNRQKWVSDDFKRVRGLSLKLKGIILDHFWWHRIVVDEAHELIENLVFREMLEYFHANHKWYVSATPFPQSISILKICTYLDFPHPKNTAQEVAHINICKTHLYWRNTKESVKNEYELPPLVEDIVMLDFSPVERIIYNDSIHYLDPRETKEVCSGPVISRHYQKAFAGETSWNKLCSLLLDYIKPKLQEHPNTISTLQKRISEAEKEQMELKAKLEKTRDKIIQLKLILEEDSRAGRALSVNALKIDRLKIKDWNICCRIKDIDAILYKSKFTLGITEDRLTNDSNSVLDLEEMEPFYNGPDMSASALLALQKEEISPQNAESVPIEPENKDDGIKDVNNLTKDENEVLQEDLLPWSQIVEFTVAKLKEELAKRGIEPNKKQTKKKQLQLLLKETPIEGSETTATLKRKNSSSNMGANKKQKKVVDPTTRTTQDKINEQNLLKWWVEKHGTKLGNLLFYLKRVWSENPDGKVIVFSQYGKLLETISNLLGEYNVANSLVDGTLNERIKKLAEFTAIDSKSRVLLLNSDENASGLNIVEANHVILMEPLEGTQGIATETQAIGRAHRQGQKSNVTVVRMIIRDTVEHNTYNTNYGITKKGSMLGDY